MDYKEVIGKGVFHGTQIAVKVLHKVRVYKLDRHPSVTDLYVLSQRLS